MAKNKYSNDMNKKMKLLIDQYDNGGFDYEELEWELLNLFNVSGSFTENDMENFAAKCMIFGNNGKTTDVLLKEFCENDR
jgi:hypothetical protein